MLGNSGKRLIFDLPRWRGAGSVQKAMTDEFVLFFFVSHFDFDNTLSDSGGFAEEERRRGHLGSHLVTLLCRQWRSVAMAEPVLGLRRDAFGDLWTYPLKKERSFNIVFELALAIA